MIEVLQEVCKLFLLFFVFSVGGWCMEVFLKYRQFHRFINRGFLIGPYCPIYGAGALFATVAVGGVAHVDSSYGTTFLVSFVVCGALEYFVSWYLEKKFHARWWDYSQKPMNLHGRVWIGNLILFGIGGTVIVKIVAPKFVHTVGSMSDSALFVLTGILAATMLTDNIVSHFVMRFVKASVENSEADDTETVSREVRYLLTHQSVLHKRFAEAYPEVIYRTDRIKARMEAVKADAEAARKRAHEEAEAARKRAHDEAEAARKRAHDEAEAARTRAHEEVESAREEMRNYRRDVKTAVESTARLKNEIIEEQTALIGLLGMENPDPEKVKRLKNSIAYRKAELEKKHMLKDLLS